MVEKQFSNGYIWFVSDARFFFEAIGLTTAFGLSYRSYIDVTNDQLLQRVRNYATKGLLQEIDRHKTFELRFTVTEKGMQALREWEKLNHEYFQYIEHNGIFEFNLLKYLPSNNTNNR